MEEEKRINLKADRKGASSLEFVLSFVLFAGVVIAIFFFFSPVKNTGIMSNSLTYAYSQIEKNAQVDLDEYSVIIRNPSVEGIEVNLPNIPQSRNARVESYYGEVLHSKREGNNVFLSVVNSNGDKEKFVAIKLSDDFEQGDLQTTPTARDFDITSSSSRKVISERRISEIAGKSYSELKNILNMSSDFSFSLVLSSGPIKVEKTSIAKKEAFADSKSVEVLKLDGTIEFGYLNVKVW